MLGVLPGVVGMLEAVETVKILLGIGEPLVGRLLQYDALSARFFEMKIDHNPDCPVCGDGKIGQVRAPEKKQVQVTQPASGGCRI